MVVKVTWPARPIPTAAIPVGGTTCSRTLASICSSDHGDSAMNGCARRSAIFGISAGGLVSDRVHNAKHVLSAMIDYAHEQVFLLLKRLAFGAVPHADRTLTNRLTPDERVDYTGVCAQHVSGLTNRNSQESARRRKRTHGASIFMMDVSR